ncbi:MAG TPA: TetR/AcrR family transcriptional regulator [Solirubrobacterales bacterium]|jgi:AcrR family transcriptional regulator|nr:TetR/AcrR family transcriptional regulator [Solirubrobacterales bacterium]
MDAEPPPADPSAQDRLQGPFTVGVEHSPEAFLTRLPVGRHGLPRDFIEENQRNRLMAAALEVFADRGYATVSVADVIKVAGVSRNTFYAYFADKEACFLATYDVVAAWLTERAAAAAGDADAWAPAVIAVIDTLTSLLAADPRLARLCTVDVYQVGAPAARRHEDLIERLTRALRAGRSAGSRGAELPPVLDAILVGGVVSLVARWVNTGEGDRLAELAPELSEALLAPYLGRAAVRELLTGL